LVAYFGFSGDASAPEVLLEEPAAAPGPPPQQGVEPAMGIGGGSIGAIAVDVNGNVFASGLDAGVFKSENRGSTWRPLTIPSNVTRVDTLTIAPSEPQTVYLGTGSGVFKSTDGGANWRAANGDLFEGESIGRREHRLLEGYVYSLVVDPRDAETVYAGTWEQGLLKTTNGGANWQRLGPGAVGALVLDPNDPETIYVGSVGAAVGGGRAVSGVSRSTDGGSTWQPVGLVGTNVGSLAIDPKTPEILYASTDKNLLRTSDGGKTWRAVGLEGWGWLSGVTIDPENPAILYAAAATGAFKSTDRGASWRSLDVGLEGRDGVNALALDPRGSATLFAGTGSGVLKSTDSGRSWEVSTAGMTGARVDDLAASTGGSAYALVSSQGFFKRTGGDWRPANAGLPTLNLSGLAVDPQRRETVYLVARGREIFTTTNGGDSWRKVHAPRVPDSTQITALAVDPENPGILYAGAYDWSSGGNGTSGVFKSTDGGVTWRALGLNELPPGDIEVLAIDPQNPRNLHAAGIGYFKSADGGATWSSPHVAQSPLRSLALDASEPGTLYAGTDGEVYKSTDAGATWRDLEAGFATGSVNAIAVNPRARKMVYAGGDDGLFFSDDGGGTWRRYPGDVGKLRIEGLAVDPTGHILYVGSGTRGVFEVSLTGS
jgi:photosystem II stability/assembly factor-like uncharacterized protein